MSKFRKTASELIDVREEREHMRREITDLKECIESL
jgi:hypothetical protein